MRTTSNPAVAKPQPVSVQKPIKKGEDEVMKRFYLGVLKSFGHIKN